MWHDSQWWMDCSQRAQKEEPLLLVKANSVKGTAEVQVE
jgi:hypothetical protein